MTAAQPRRETNAQPRRETAAQPRRETAAQPRRETAAEPRRETAAQPSRETAAQPRRETNAPSPETLVDNRGFRARELTKPPVAGAVWALEGVRGRGDAEVARIAELQRGVIHRSQLLAAGLGPDAIRHRLATRRLHRLYRGVYLLGRPRLEPLAAATAAVIHLGGRGVLSHRSAASIWGLMQEPELPVELTVVDAELKPRRGLIIHRARALSRADIRASRGLPVTSPARTLLDLAGLVSSGELEAAYASALRRGLTGRAELTAAAERAPYKRGIGTLRELLEHGQAPSLTRSGYERKLRDLLKVAELPAPLVNARVAGHEVDFLWPQQRLVVEFDGFAFHSDRAAFERDRLRDQHLVAAGYRVIRITARQLDRTPEAVIARIAAALAQ